MNAKTRERAGKGVARTLRREGRVPAVIYGGEAQPAIISLDSKDINLEYYKGHMMTNICNLKVDDKEQKVIARDVALHPVTDVVEHVDFLRVTEKTRVTVPVPIHVTNFEGSPAELAGGVVSFATHEVMIECRATLIPDEITFDLSKAELGTTVYSDDLKLPERTNLGQNAKGLNLFSVDLPRIIAEPEPEELEGEVDAAGDVPSEHGSDGDDAEGEAKEGDKAE